MGHLASQPVDLGATGIWTFQLDLQPAAAAIDAVRELESLGYGAIWLPEAVGKEPLTHAAVLLGGTDRIALATGIVGIWGRDAMTAAAGQRTLCEAYPGRFLLGLGVSHGPMVEGMRGQRYERPLEKMRAYLDAMDRAIYAAAQPASTPRVLAALGPRMLALAAERAEGTHPYFVPPEHTVLARHALGPDRLLAVEQAVVLERDAARAREVARAHMAIYLGLPNYANNLRRLGFSDDDLASGGSDRLVDAIVAWGDVGEIASRVADHRGAGADHVCIQVLDPDPRALPMPQWRELADALLG